jgi:hypothetical protein
MVRALAGDSTITSDVGIGGQLMGNGAAESSVGQGRHHRVVVIGEQTGGRIGGGVGASPMSTRYAYP